MPQRKTTTSKQGNRDRKAVSAGGDDRISKALACLRRAASVGRRTI
jgi:hypothetical protein